MCPVFSLSIKPTLTLACTRLSVSEDDRKRSGRKRERAKNDGSLGKSEGMFSFLHSRRLSSSLFPRHPLFFARPLFRSSPLSESLAHATLKCEVMFEGREAKYSSDVPLSRILVHTKRVWPRLFERRITLSTG